MPKIIFDIETVGVEFESLDNKSKESLLSYAESEEEIEAIKKDSLIFDTIKESGCYIVKYKDIDDLEYNNIVCDATFLQELKNDKYMEIRGII